MSEKFFEELEDRRTAVEKLDFDIQAKNRDYFRSFWLQMIILSSAIVVGILPIMGQSTTLIRSLILAKLGLLLIILVCVSIIFYFQNMLSKERNLLFEQIQFHKETFAKQLRFLDRAKREGKSEKEMESIFNESKSNVYIQEQQIIARHLVVGKFVKIRLFLDKYFNNLISCGFVSGVLLVVLSFILRV